MVDNKTHMMFHDADVREEGREEGQDLTIRKMIKIFEQLNVPKEKTKQRIQQTFKHSDAQLADLFKAK